MSAHDWTAIGLLVLIAVGAIVAVLVMMREEPHD